MCGLPWKYRRTFLSDTLPPTTAFPESTPVLRKASSWVTTFDMKSFALSISYS
jgi:hypothetical protein